ncbi:DMT family transporter [Pseudorhodoplanes sp.]|uniref:DMT family transporter n=1 Tax=Pseudorhodoplanes sp. TaxID=1934341 RepID=UPI003D13BB27
MPDHPFRHGLSATAIGVSCGIAASICWAIGFVAAKHGIAVGFAPADLAFHRFVWSGVLMLPLLARVGLSDLGGLGWVRGLVILVLAGPLQALLNYTGLTLAPLGHGAVIQPGSAALGGLLLAFLVLGEPLSRARLIGVGSIILGLTVLAGEAVLTIRGGALAGDLLFAAAGFAWAAFTLCLRGWRTSGMLAAQVVGVLSLLIYAPLYAGLVDFERLSATGLSENLIQVVAQGVFAGLLALYLFARAVTALGAGRASMFPALVPAMTILIGFLVLGEIPTLPQLAGLLIVGFGFRFALKP